MKIIDIPPSMLELLSLRVDGDEPWDAPGEVELKLEPVSPFQRKLLPDVLADFVFDEALRMQCPPDFVAVAAMTMLGSVIGAGCSVRPKQHDDWTEVPNLWGGVVGRPGSLKSPAISAGMAPLAWLESDARRDYDDDCMWFSTRDTQRDMELKVLKSDKGHIKLKLTEKEAIARVGELTEAKRRDKPPTLKRFRTNDATVEMIGQLAQDSSRGLLYMRDELVGLLAGCDKQGHEGDRAFFLEAWNGRSSFAVDRVGRGSIVIPRLCLSLFGGIQPARLQEYIAGTIAGYDNDGLLQRFQLSVFPDEVKSWTYIDKPPNQDARDKVIAIVRKLAETDFLSLGAQDAGTHGIPFFRFSESAQPVFIGWLTNLERVIRLVESPVLAEHIGKYRKLVPALALIFHLVDLAGGKNVRKPGISKQALKRAIDFGRYLESHAVRIYALALDPVQSAVAALAVKIRSGKLVDGFSERDVYKAEWSQLGDPQVVQGACRELELDGWIRRIHAERGAGRPASPCYNINPALKPK